MDRDRIASEALRMDPKDRALLAEAIWESLEDPYVVGADMSDEEAIRLAMQRDAEMESGKAMPIAHQELMDRLRMDEG